jgi:hypothetical protein
VLALEREIGAAVVHGDAAFYDRVTAADFVDGARGRMDTGR